ncbi:hypothetical protein SY83_14345 [Paenibacillus swuensis]|uniref:Carotenoid biosynthesis protein n=1 Tax=Paenibacillus swuensis TaxID=1178515 RepID=A0A172TJV3_9BACL|nr:carotenoid biosynthesis protein [Paenibacillus swuensis]ANE47252.1 hypothetical protein SY83_14345 [Paenibacillus swuensis]
MTNRKLFWGWYAIGLGLMLFYHVPGPLQFANGLFLLFYAAYALWIGKDYYSTHPFMGWRIVALIVLTYALEYCGTVTGFPFGPYEYTPLLGFAPVKVPIAISSAWVGVMASALALSRARSVAMRAVEVGVYAVLFDLVLDPVAAARGFWNWQTEGWSWVYYGVPLQNFAGWFAAAALLSLLFPMKRRNDFTTSSKREALRLYQAMLLMFGLLAMKEGMLLPGALSVVFCLVAEGVQQYGYSSSKKQAV